MRATARSSRSRPAVRSRWVWSGERQLLGRGRRRAGRPRDRQHASCATSTSPTRRGGGEQAGRAPARVVRHARRRARRPGGDPHRARGRRPPPRDPRRAAGAGARPVGDRAATPAAPRASRRDRRRDGVPAGADRRRRRRHHRRRRAADIVRARRSAVCATEEELLAASARRDRAKATRPWRDRARGHRARRDRGAPRAPAAAAVADPGSRVAVETLRRDRAHHDQRLAELRAERDAAGRARPGRAPCRRSRTAEAARSEAEAAVDARRTPRSRRPSEARDAAAAERT